MLARLALMLTEILTEKTEKLRSEQLEIRQEVKRLRLKVDMGIVLTRSDLKNIDVQLKKLDWVELKLKCLRKISDINLRLIKFFL